MKLNQDAPPLKGDETYPKNWPHVYISDSCTRFGARFRIAKAFQAVKFGPGIKPPTADAYSALVRFGVVYSAFEGFIKNFHASKGREFLSLEQTYPPQEILQIIDRERASGSRLLTKIAEFVESDMRARVLAIISGTERSAFTLAAAVRHAYVHGHLTASAAGSGPAHTKVLVDGLSQYLLMIMDETGGALASAKLERQKKRANRATQTTPGVGQKTSGLDS